MEHSLPFCRPWRVAVISHLHFRLPHGMASGWARCGTGGEAQADGRAVVALPHAAACSRLESPLQLAKCLRRRLWLRPAGSACYSRTHACIGSALMGGVACPAGFCLRPRGCGLLTSSHCLHLCLGYVTDRLLPVSSSCECVFLDCTGMPCFRDEHSRCSDGHDSPAACV